MKLRAYQEQALAGIRTALRRHRTVLLRLPTGGGKTRIAGEILGGVAAKGYQAWFLVHRKELLDQTSDALHKLDLDHGFVASGRAPRYNKPILLCGVQTLVNRLDRIVTTYGQPKLIIVDEAHHCAAGTWRKILDACPNSMIIGLTATPERLDGKGLDDTFSALVEGPSERWLMEQGYWCAYRVFTHAPPQEIEGAKMRGADFDGRETGAIMSQSYLLGDAVAHYKEICPGTNAIAFCSSIDHAVATRDAFLAAGIVAEELDGNADPAHRKAVMDAFRARKIKVLTGVDLFGEGLDVPAMETAILLRPTKSLGLYRQMVGRMMRPAYAPGMPLETAEQRHDAMQAGPKPTGFVLDHAGNVQRHGMPDEDIKWSLGGRGKRRGGASQKTCSSCFGALPTSASQCVFCGHLFTSEAGSREVILMDGKLVEVDAVQFRRMRKDEEVRAQTLEELIAIGKRRGYRAGWANFKWKARQKRSLSTAR